MLVTTKLTIVQRFENKFQNGAHIPIIYFYQNIN